MSGKGDAKSAAAIDALSGIRSDALCWLLVYRESGTRLDSCPEIPVWFEAYGAMDLRYSTDARRGYAGFRFYPHASTAATQLHRRILSDHPVDRLCVVHTAVPSFVGAARERDHSAAVHQSSAQAASTTPTPHNTPAALPVSHPAHIQAPVPTKQQPHVAAHLEASIDSPVTTSSATQITGPVLPPPFNLTESISASVGGDSATRSASIWPMPAQLRHCCNGGGTPIVYLYPYGFTPSQLLQIQSEFAAATRVDVPTTSRPYVGPAVTLNPMSLPDVGSAATSNPTSRPDVGSAATSNPMSSQIQVEGQVDRPAATTTAATTMAATTAWRSQRTVPTYHEEERKQRRPSRRRRQLARLVSVERGVRLYVNNVDIGYSAKFASWQTAMRELFRPYGIVDIYIGGIARSRKMYALVTIAEQTMALRACTEITVAHVEISHHQPGSFFQD